MSDELLRVELGRVTRRYRELYRRLGLVLVWTVLGLAGMGVLTYLRGGDWRLAAVAAAVMAGLTVVVGAFLAYWAKRAGDTLWLARRIERQHPELDARLLAAVEQRPGKAEGLGFLQQVVIEQAVMHSRKAGWVEMVPTGSLRVARVANWVMFLIFAGVAAKAGWVWAHVPTDVKPVVAVVPAFEVKVEPGDTSVERGAALLVMARFGNNRVPGEVELLFRDGDGAVQTLAMSKSLDDPLFAVRVPAVKRDGTYAVRYGSDETKWYKVGVFDYPQLKQADATLRYPQYTGLDAKEVKDTRSVTGVEGTNVTFTFHLNKPVAEARLVPTRRPVESGGAAAATVPAGRGARGGAVTPVTPVVAATAPAVPLALAADPKDPTAYTLTMDLKQSQVYRVELVDADRRANRDQAQMTVNVTANRPVDLKVLSPNRDLDVSALEEITVRAQVWDDYGVKRVGMTYAIAGQKPQDIVLAENIPGKERKDVAEIVSLEKLKAQVDQLLSYHLWAEDMGPDGKVRRTEGAMYFADVRPFEEIYRQGEALAQGQEEQQQQQQQRQQQQQGQQGNQNTQRADQVAQTLKQVIAATWNIQRRETGDTLSPQFVPDVTNVENSQSRIKEQTEGMGDQVTDERSQQFLESGLKNMDGALEQLKLAEATPTAKALPEALNFEQAAYQDLLKLRAREFEVTRGNRQQGQQNAAQQRRQQQLDQMNVAQQNNPYQMRRNAQQSQQPQDAQQAQQESDQQRETRQVLSRLRELAQRQEDLNRQMQEMQAALQQAQDPQQREELQRQLANLREQQQQQLRDADELRDRMDQPQNQEQMANARQQLDQTRNNIQQAAQNMANGQMQQAAAAGQRAAEQLNNLQNQMRQAAAGQFGQAMTQMRAEARNLEQNQGQIDQRLTNLNQPAQTAPTGLRNVSEQTAAQERSQLAQNLQQQRQQLDNLLNNMQQTIEQADAPQPLLSRQLYDTYRQTQQQQPDQALNTSRQLVQQGLLQEAQQTNGDATQTITRMREGVDQAAGTVLGDEAAALRRAQQQLDELQQQLERERGGLAAAQAGTQPGRGDTRGRGALAGTQPGDRGGVGTQPGRGALAGMQPGTGTQPDERQLAQNDGQRGGQPGARGGQPGRNGAGGRDGAGTQPDDQQLAQNDGQRGGQPGARGGQPGARGDQARGGAGAGTQPGDDQQLARGGAAGLRGQPGLRQGGQDGQNPADPQPLAQGGQEGQPGEQDMTGGRAGGTRGGQRGTQLARGGAGTQPGEQPGRGGSGAGTQPGDPQFARGGRGDMLQGGAMDLVGPGGGPITGDDYRNFTDTLRDVEELVTDPRLRDQAARIRQQVSNLRQEYQRVSRPPAWNIVQETVNRPLTELRQAVSQELLRRESAQAAVPLDKDAVPPAYQDQVKTYYERLGSGK